MEMIQPSNFGEYRLTETSSLRSYQHSSRKRHCCHSSSNGFAVIVSSFGVFTVAITVALIIQINYGSPEVTPHAAVASDSSECSLVGTKIMRDGGNAVDAAVATLFCMSVVHPHVVGVGGGGVMLVHDHLANTSSTINFMSSVPSRYDAHERANRYTHTTKIGVPGFIPGLEYAQRRYGVLSWAKVIQPAVNIARNGFIVTKELYQSLKNVTAVKSGQLTSFVRNFILKDYRIGGIITRMRYASFLEYVAHEGARAMFSGDFGDDILATLRRSGSPITKEDFINYEVLERPSHRNSIRNMTLMTSPEMTGGPQFIASLKILENSDLTDDTLHENLYLAIIKAFHTTYFKLIELLSGRGGDDPLGLVAWAENVTINDSFSFHWGDAPPIMLTHEAATQVSVIDTFDMHVSAVVGIGGLFGSRVMSDSGVLFNNHLQSLVPNNVSGDEAFRRPLVPYTPAILMDSNNKCGLRVVLASPKVDAALQVASQILFRHKNMTWAIKEPRITIPPAQDKVLVEDLAGFERVLSGKVRNVLKGSGLDILAQQPPFPSVNGISKLVDRLTSHSDTRGGGVAARLEKLTIP